MVLILNLNYHFAATPKLASKGAIRESIRLAIVPTIDSVKTYGLVSIPGMDDRLNYWWRTTFTSD